MPPAGAKHTTWDTGSLCLLRPGVGIISVVSEALQGSDLKDEKRKKQLIVPILFRWNSSFRRPAAFPILVAGLQLRISDPPGLQFISCKLLGHWTRHGWSWKRWLQLRRVGGHLGPDATPLVATRLRAHFGKTFLVEKMGY